MRKSGLSPSGSPPLDHLTVFLSISAFLVSLTITLYSQLLWPYGLVWPLGTLLVCPLLLFWPISRRARSVTWCVFLGSAGAVMLWTGIAFALRAIR